jgi:trehalose synthase
MTEAIRRPFRRPFRSGRSAVPLHPHEVSVPPLSTEPFRKLLDEEEWQAFERGLEQIRRLLEGRVLWNMNSTAAGGGVAEMLRFFVAYARGSGIDMRWSVIEGNVDFFSVTKRIHNLLHGDPGDGGELGDPERAVYEEVIRKNADDFRTAIRAEDVVILHDPQTAGLVPHFKGQAAAVLWRSHVGAETANARVRAAWEFLAPYLTEADACVFSRHAYVPDWANAIRTVIIQPSIDPLSPKNQDLDRDVVRAILAHVGLIVGDVPGDALPVFKRYDGSPGRVDRLCEVISSGPPPAVDVPVVTQVSRWDRLKDPLGVMEGFAEHGIDSTEAHLVLAGPNVSGVADDPEGATVLDEVEAAWRKLPAGKRARVHLACLPMADIDENAAIVNALQRHATVVVQKSIQEGFGLTVAEAMWKSRPAVASAVGGIRDQIEDGKTGILLEDPQDLQAFGKSVLGLLAHPERAHAIGQNAHERVRRHFLANRHALQYIELLASLLGERVETTGGADPDA